MATMENNKELSSFKISLNAAETTTNWQKWIRSFDLYLLAKSIKGDVKRQATLLHLAGTEVQDIFYNIGGEEITESLFENTKKLLLKHFSPKVNITYQRYLFGQVKQNEDCVENFILRLTKQANICQFLDKDDQIRDQFIKTCNSNELRMKLLEQEELTLQKLITLSTSFEHSREQAKEIGLNNFTTSDATVSRIATRNNYNSFSKNSSKLRCYRCNKNTHLANGDCPAKTEKCHKCGMMGHFQKACKTKTSIGEVRQLSETDIEEITLDMDKYIFNIIHDIEKNDLHEIEIGGVKLKVQIDSGASCNVIDINSWNYLKTNKIRCISEKGTANIFGYGGTKLEIIGRFTCDLMVKTKLIKNVKFYVMNGKGIPILGRNTSIEAEMLKVGFNVYNIKQYQSGNFVENAVPQAMTLEEIEEEPARDEEMCSLREHILNDRQSWPQAIGEIVRQNRSLLKILQIAQANKVDWKDELLKYLLMYRTTPHCTTGKAPGDLLFNYVMRDKIPDLRQQNRDDEEARDSDIIKKWKGKRYGDTRRNAEERPDYETGEKVLIKNLQKGNKLDTNFENKRYEVVHQKGPEVLVKSDDGASYRRHSTAVRKYNEAGGQCMEDQIQDVQESGIRPERNKCLPTKFEDYIM